MGYKIMNKKTEKNKSINDIIERLNKPTYIGLILLYAVVLIFLSIVLFPESKFVLTPNYSHNIGQTEVYPEIRINPNLTVNSTGNVINNYRITAVIDGEYKEGDENKNYLIDKFQMSTLLSTEKVYYFTEQSNNKTRVQHYYNLDNSSKVQIPSEMFIKLIYSKEGMDTKTLTFKEEILQIGDLSQYSDYNVIKDGDVTRVRIIFANTLSNNINTLRNKIDVDDIINEEKIKFHIDMQSWLVSEDKEILPSIGVYGFTNQSYYLSGISNFDEEFKAEYIYSKLVYHIEGKEPQVILYKERIAQLPTSTNNPPSDPTGIPKTEPFIGIEEIILIVVGSVIIISLVVGNVIIKKKNKKNNIIDKQND